MQLRVSVSVRVCVSLFSCVSQLSISMYIVAFSLFLPFLFINCNASPHFSAQAPCNFSANTVREKQKDTSENPHCCDTFFLQHRPAPSTAFPVRHPCRRRQCFRSLPRSGWCVGFRFSPSRHAFRAPRQRGAACQAPLWFCPPARGCPAW